MLNLPNVDVHIFVTFLLIFSMLSFLCILSQASEQGRLLCEWQMSICLIRDWYIRISSVNIYMIFYKVRLKKYLNIIVIKKRWCYTIFKTMISISHSHCLTLRKKNHWYKMCWNQFFWLIWWYFNCLKWYGI